MPTSFSHLHLNTKTANYQLLLRVGNIGMKNVNCKMKHYELN